LSVVDQSMASNFRDAERAMDAADSMGSYAVAALTPLATWSYALQPDGHAAFAEDSLIAVTPWRETIDLAAETVELQRRSTIRPRFAVDPPLWRLFAWGRLDDLFPGSPSALSPYVVAWVADNPADGDGDASVDRDGVMVLRAVAFLGTLRHTVEIFLRREDADTTVSTSPEAGDEPAGQQGDSGMAGILPSGGAGELAASGGERLRVLSWRDVP